MMWTRLGRTTGDSRASRHAAAAPRPPCPRPWPRLHAACLPVCVCVSLSWSQEQRFIHPTDSSFFWAVLFAAPILWGVLAFLALITFKVMWGLLTGAPPARPEWQLATPERPLPLASKPPKPPKPPKPHPAGVALTCNAINVVGYVKCKKDARKKLSALGGSVMLKGMEMWSSRKGAASGA